MAVNNIVAAVEIALALKIQINRTRDILLAVKIMVQVKVVVRSLDDGIIDVGPLDGNPAHGVRILRPKGFKIDRRLVRLRLRFRLGFSLRLSCLRFFGSLARQLRQTVVLVLCPLVLQPLAEHHPAADH